MSKYDLDNMFLQVATDLRFFIFCHFTVAFNVC